MNLISLMNLMNLKLNLIGMILIEKNLLLFRYSMVNLFILSNPLLYLSYLKINYLLLIRYFIYLKDSNLLRYYLSLHLILKNYCYLINFQLFEN